MNIFGVIKLRIVSIVLLSISIIISGCTQIFSSDQYTKKQDVVKYVKDNIDDLNLLIKELKQEFKNEEYVTIENKLFKIWNNSKTYYSKTSMEVFERLKIDYISILNYSDATKDSIRTKFGDDIYMNYKDYRIMLKIKNPSGCNFGVYYTLEDDKYYLHSKKDESDLYISSDNYMAYIKKDSLRSGWYTEMICDNWYYYEEGYDDLHFLNYIKEDIKQLDIYPRIYDRFKKYFTEDERLIHSIMSILPKGKIHFVKRVLYCIVK